MSGHRPPVNHPDHDRPALAADAFDPSLAAVRALARVWFRAIRDRDLEAALIERDAFAWSLGAAVQRAIDDEWTRTGREANLIAGATAGEAA